MAIDARIALGVQPLQLPQQDPNAGMNALATMLKISGAMDEQKLNALTYQDKQRTVERRNKLDSLLGGFNGKPDELAPTLLRGGFLDEAGKIEKDRREAEKSSAEAAFKRIETAHKTVELTGQAMGWLRQNPTLENATAAIGHLVTVGGMPQEQGQQILTTLQANPDKVGNFADMVFRSALATKEQLPKLQTNNIGGSTVTQQFDPVTGKQLGVASSVQNTQSPDNAASVAATRRGQDLVNQRALDTAAQGKWQYDATRGGLVNMQTGEFKAATQGGKPIGPADKAMTEGQAKANLFGSRMKEADRILTGLEGEYMPGAVNAKMAAGEIPVVGGVAGYAGNLMLSDKGQSAEQAQRDFINAVLRRESGATIQPSEFSNAQKQYFPQAGDSKTVLAQKRANRALAIKGLEAEVPGGFRGTPTLTSTGQNGGASGDFGGGANNDPLGLRK